jgi:hypothetical protein
MLHGLMAFKPDDYAAYFYVPEISMVVPVVVTPILS